MKIPTKHINTKQTLLATGALVAVVGLVPTATTFAHGGGESRGNWNGYSASGHYQDNKGNKGSVEVANSGNKPDTKNNSGKHYNHGGNYDAQKWWGKFSSADFKKYNDAKLAKLDAIIAKNNLTVENGDALRAAVVTNADELTANLTALEQLRASIDKSNITDEQKAALKAQTLTTFESFYDYYESVYEFKAAIKASADAKGAQTDIKVEQED